MYIYVYIYTYARACVSLVADFTKVRTAFYGVLIKSLASLKGSILLYSYYTCTYIHIIYILYVHLHIYFTFNVFYNFRTSRPLPHCIYEFLSFLPLYRSLTSRVNGCEEYVLFSRALTQV